MLFNDKLPTEKVKSLNVLVLAFVGDAAHTLYVRTRLCEGSDAKTGALHSFAKRHVSANGQAAAFDIIAPKLTDEEASLCRRARNHHNKTTAKNADLAAYKKATAFEALIGYHYLLNNDGRLKELLELAMTP